MAGYRKLNSLTMGLLAFTSVLAAPGRMFLQIYPHELKKQKGLPDGSIEERVRRNLAKSEEDKDAIPELFLMDDEAVPSLIKFLRSPDKEMSIHAARRRAYIGNQQGVKALRNTIKTERDKEAKSVMSYFFAGGLVATELKSDLDFLKSSVERARFVKGDQGDDRAFPAVSAALALGMMGASDAVEVLRRAAKVDLVDSDEIVKAIRWIENKSIAGQSATPPALNEEELIKKIVLNDTSFAQGDHDKTSLEHLTFNRGKSKALVSLKIASSSRNARGYDLVLAKESGTWRVVGVWFTWIT